MDEMDETADNDSLHLVASAQQGDQAALDALLRRHLPGLRVFIRSRSGQKLRAKESCSDLVQTVCREALGILDQYEWQGEGSFRHWLFTVAMHKIQTKVHYYGAAKRDPAREARKPTASESCSEAELLDVYQTMCGPSQHAIGKEAVENFEACMDQLSEQYREVILLSRVVGLSHEEIGEKLERSAGAVRVMLSRALARLATIMESRESGP